MLFSDVQWILIRLLYSLSEAKKKNLGVIYIRRKSDRSTVPLGSPGTDHRPAAHNRFPAFKTSESEPSEKSPLQALFPINRHTFIR